MLLLLDGAANNVLGEYASVWEAEMRAGWFRELNPHMEFSAPDIDDDEDDGGGS